MCRRVTRLKLESRYERESISNFPPRGGCGIETDYKFINVTVNYYVIGDSVLHNTALCNTPQDKAWEARQMGSCADEIRKIWMLALYSKIFLEFTCFSNVCLEFYRRNCGFRDSVELIRKNCFFAWEIWEILVRLFMGVLRSYKFCDCESRHTRSTGLLNAGCFHSVACFAKLCLALFSDFQGCIENFHELRRHFIA